VRWVNRGEVSKEQRGDAGESAERKIREEREREGRTAAPLAFMTRSSNNVFALKRSSTAKGA
jgi:hypothetical protein